MKLIVVTYPVPVKDEVKIINCLFEEGLEFLHLRKPDYSIRKTEELLNSIDLNYFSRIVLHQHHELAENFPISRFHYSEAERKKTKEIELINRKNNFNILSTSIHQIDDHKNLSACFDYCFFGPVFNSISKQGYVPAISNNFSITEHAKTKIIAIGGIDESKIDDIKKMKFSGIALLGAIWQNKNPIDGFKKIKEKCLKSEFAY